jgi:GNAT superfamily N-acetyltransferase
VQKVQKAEATMDSHTAETYSPRHAGHVRELTDMFTAYIHEELDRTGKAAPGMPVADFLATLILKTGDEVTGFCSVDIARHAVELIYVKPAHRRQGRASQLLRYLAAGCPDRLGAKTPLTPAGRALAESLDLRIIEMPPEEIAAAEQSMRQLDRDLSQHCRHKRGNPARPCRRCYRQAMARTAEVLITAYAARYWLTAA